MSSLPNQTAVTAAPINLSPGSSRANILIADGDEDYRQLYSDLLRFEGFQTFCAKDAAQALAVLHQERIDIALVDVMIPRTNGMTLCRELRANPETRLVPILLLTGWESDQDYRMGIESGVDADAHLKKPINNMELISRVRALLDKKLFTDNLADTEKMLLTFAEIVEAKDPYNAGHGYRVSRTAVALAVRMGLSLENREWVRRGALLHDIGKVGSPGGDPGEAESAEQRREGDPQLAYLFGGAHLRPLGLIPSSAANHSQPSRAPGREWISGRSARQSDLAC